MPYRPAVSAAIILIGWPLLWMALRRDHESGRQSRAGAQATFAQVLTVVVHASAVFALRSLIAAPVNYARESLGGATSLSMVMPAFGESTFPARLLGAVDIFVLWWMALVAIGLGMLYGRRARCRSRAGCLASTPPAQLLLALTQALRGGI